MTYLGDRVSAVTARTRYGWVKPREYGELLHGRRIPLRLKGTVYRSYVGQQYCIEVKHGA